MALPKLEKYGISFGDFVLRIVLFPMTPNLTLLQNLWIFTRTNGKCYKLLALARTEVLFCTLGMQRWLHKTVSFFMHVVLLPRMYRPRGIKWRLGRPGIRSRAWDGFKRRMAYCWIESEFSGVRHRFDDWRYCCQRSFSAAQGLESLWLLYVSAILMELLQGLAKSQVSDLFSLHSNDSVVLNVYRPGSSSLQTLRLTSRSRYGQQ